MNCPAFILGNSPWLPVDDLECLRYQFTVGVNRILMAGYTPTVLLWVDGSVYDDDDHGAMIDASDALLVCDKSVWRHERHIGLKTHVGDMALKRQSTPTVLCVNGSTGCCAARWAVALGCEPVYLVGMEATYAAGQTDFYGQNDRHHPGSTLAVMKKEMTRLRADCCDKLVAVTCGAMLRKIVSGHAARGQDTLRRDVLGAMATLPAAPCPS